MSVHTEDSKERDRAKEIFVKGGAEDISYTGKASASKDHTTTERSPTLKQVIRSWRWDLLDPTSRLSPRSSSTACVTTAGESDSLLAVIEQLAASRKSKL
jgi:hypothetical protein